MKVFGKCENCEQKNGFWTFTNTRIDYAKNVGEYKTLKCKNCGHSHNIHVDDLFAKESKVAHIVALLIFLIGTPLAFFILNPILVGETNHYTVYIVGGFMVVPVIIFGIIKKQDETRVSAFNRVKLRSRRKK
jgi:hypothetical protein